MKNLTTLFMAVFMLFCFSIGNSQQTVDTIKVSADTYVKRLADDNYPGANGTNKLMEVRNGGDGWEHSDFGWIGNGYKNNYSRTALLKFDISSLPESIDSVVFSVTPQRSDDGWDDMMDPPFVTHYIAHVPVEEGINDNWDEATMYFDLAVTYWSYNQGLEGDNWWWLREALNDTTMVGSLDIYSAEDTVPKFVNVTEAVQNNPGDLMTLAIYDRDRDPDWWDVDVSKKSNEVREGHRISYRSKDDSIAPENEKPILLVYATPTAVDDVMGAADIKMYPNPANNQLFVELPNFQKAEVRLIDITGKTIKTISMNGKHNIDISELNSGYYILNIDNGVNTIMKKFIKL